MQTRKRPLRRPKKVGNTFHKSSAECAARVNKVRNVESGRCRPSFLSLTTLVRKKKELSRQSAHQRPLTQPVTLFRNNFTFFSLKKYLHIFRVKSLGGTDKSNFRFQSVHFRPADPTFPNAPLPKFLNRY